MMELEKVLAGAIVGALFGALLPIIYAFLLILFHSFVFWEVPELMLDSELLWTFVRGFALSGLILGGVIGTRE